VPTFTQGAISLLARWLVSIIFLTSAYSKLFGWSANVEYMHSKHMPATTLLLASALLVEAVGSFCLITGLGARIAATVMFFYMIPVTFLLHEFMSVNFQKNLGLMGGLLMITAFGPGKIALEPRTASSSAPAPASN
jgi:putative oxidoreductase